MIILGAGGHAREILQILIDDGCQEDIFFYDDVNKNIHCLYDKYFVFHNIEEVRQYKQQRFIIGVGTPSARYNFSNSFVNVGLKLSSLISKDSVIGTQDVSLGQGLNIMKKVFISNSVVVKEGALLNFGSNLHHDSLIGKYCEIGPKAQVLGGATIGDFSILGAGAIVLPKIKIGSNVIIGAGAVVTKDIPDGVCAVGVPAKIIY